ncbi:PHB depolymerase family esterase [Sulfitobacter sp. F26169L]|uniref:extracellular catalytic domain type 1 short-chain-length polyhydroxyalkanoate depolymerase n=1 Tax=Sulfitobacter sp. F26169L TaxID=2996015 RepID=UPI002260F77B|nr:PHB depolymerase family esterase [Sulfitobacter sp. F26169L]MCX7567726.1 PHB depolymerase family esterase [Sulfitobacter sp. F26169L]
MFDPFKRTRRKAAKRLQRTAVSAINDAWGSALAPAKPAKRKAAKKAGTSASSRKTVRKSKDAKPAAKSKPLTTSRLEITVPRGATFTDGTYNSAEGARSYKIYIPVIARKAEKPVPLIVMLHGCGQTPDDFARGTGMNALAEEFGFLVLYPAQSRHAHLNRCWNWFKREDQARALGEPAIIAGLTRQVIATQNIDPAKIYVAGLSAGASAAMIVATAYPDIFAAVGVHSGLPAGAAHDAGSASRAMQIGNPGNRHEAPVPTIIFHGDADKVVNPRNSRFITIRALEPFSGLTTTERKGRIADGREFTRLLHRVGKGRPYVEQWIVHGTGHAWSGGHPTGSYTDPAGPDASHEMVRFFLKHRTTKKKRAQFGS